MAVKTHRHCYLYTLSSAEHTSVHTNTGLHSIEVKQQRFSYIMYYNIGNSPEYTKINWISNYRKQWLTWLTPTALSRPCLYMTSIQWAMTCLISAATSQQWKLIDWLDSCSMLKILNWYCQFIMFWHFFLIFSKIMISEFFVTSTT